MTLVLDILVGAILVGALANLLIALHPKRQVPKLAGTTHRGA